MKYRSDLIDVERHVNPVRLEHDLSTVVSRLPYLGKTPTRYGVFSRELDIVGVKRRIIR